jgi:hypothetical protein
MQLGIQSTLKGGSHEQFQQRSRPRVQPIQKFLLFIADLNFLRAAGLIVFGATFTLHFA